MVGVCGSTDTDHPKLFARPFPFSLCVDVTQPTVMPVDSTTTPSWVSESGFVGHDVSLVVAPLASRTRRMAAQPGVSYVHGRICAAYAR